MDAKTTNAWMVLEEASAYLVAPYDGMGKPIMAAGKACSSYRDLLMTMIYSSNDAEKLVDILVAQSGLVDVFRTIEIDVSWRQGGPAMVVAKEGNLDSDPARKTEWLKQVEAAGKTELARRELARPALPVGYPISQEGAAERQLFNANVYGGTHGPELKWALAMACAGSLPMIKAAIGDDEAYKSIAQLALQLQHNAPAWGAVAARGAGAHVARRDAEEAMNTIGSDVRLGGLFIAAPSGPARINAIAKNALAAEGLAPRRGTRYASAAARALESKWKTQEAKLQGSSGLGK